MIEPNQWGKLAKLADWKTAKAEHKKFMNVLLQSDMHIICCIRAAEKMDFTNPKQPTSIGIQPLCEKNFMFEMTASVMMSSEGKNQQHLKIPKDLKKIFGNGQGYLGQDTGKALIDWIGSGNIDEELESYRNKMQLASNDGTEALTAAWKAMPKAMQEKMKSHRMPLWESAKAVDELNKQPENDAPNIEDGYQAPEAKEKNEYRQAKEEAKAPDTEGF